MALANGVGPPQRSVARGEKGKRVAPSSIWALDPDIGVRGYDA